MLYFYKAKRTDREKSVLSGVWVNIEKAGIKNLLFLRFITSQVWVFMI